MISTFYQACSIVFIFASIQDLVLNMRISKADFGSAEVPNRCTLATPTIEDDGVTVKLSSKELGVNLSNAGFKLWVGYVETLIDFLYVGCSNAAIGEKKTLKFKDVGRCYSICKMKYIAISGNLCFCLYSKPRIIHSNKCDTECDQPSKTLCGKMTGKNSTSFSIYKKGDIDNVYYTTGKSKKRWIDGMENCSKAGLYPAEYRHGEIDKVVKDDGTYWIGGIRSVVIEKNTGRSYNSRRGYIEYGNGHFELRFDEISEELQGLCTGDTELPHTTGTPIYTIYTHKENALPPTPLTTTIAINPPNGNDIPSVPPTTINPINTFQDAELPYTTGTPFNTINTHKDNALPPTRPTLSTTTNTINIPYITDIPPIPPTTINTINIFQVAVYIIVPVILILAIVLCVVCFVRRKRASLRGKSSQSPVFEETVSKGRLGFTGIPNPEYELSEIQAQNEASGTQSNHEYHILEPFSEYAFVKDDVTNVYDTTEKSIENRKKSENIYNHLEEIECRYGSVNKSVLREVRQGDEYHTIDDLRFKSMAGKETIYHNTGVLGIKNTCSDNMYQNVKTNTK